VRENQAESFYTWKQSGKSRGAWQTWERIASLLPEITPTPDYKQMTGYVESILVKWHRLLDA
jgi:hypothetical protein